MKDCRFTIRLTGDEMALLSLMMKKHKVRKRTALLRIALKALEEKERRKEKGEIKITLPDFAIEEYLKTGRPKSACSAARRIAAVTSYNEFLPCPFMSGLGLQKEQGVEMFSDDSLKKCYELPLFKVIMEHNKAEFGCPLRKFRYGGHDPYSVYAFSRFLEDETLRKKR